MRNFLQWENVLIPGQINVKSFNKLYCYHFSVLCIPAEGDKNNSAGHLTGHKRQLNEVTLGPTAGVESSKKTTETNVQPYTIRRESEGE